MELLFLLIMAFCIVSFVILIINWTIHLEMNSNNSDVGWGSYSDFKLWFQKYNWKGDVCFKGSLWDREMNCKYHASIIQFEGMNMKIRDPFSYLLVIIYVNRYIKNVLKSSRVSFNQKLNDKRGAKEGYQIELPDGEKVYVSIEEIYGRKLD